MPLPPPVETFTQYDKDKDAYHCSYGPVAPARAIWDPEREIQVRLDLTSRRVVGFSIPNEFVVGYGLDYNETYRNLPYIGVLKHCVYANPE